MTDTTYTDLTVYNGSNGVDGNDGVGIASIALISGAHTPGTSDIYRITLN